MKLRIVTPLSVVVDEDGVLALRAEDCSGGFGILPRHADFLTSLVISIVSWKSGDGKRRYCAVRRGVLSVTGGEAIAIATREAVAGEDLLTLDQTVLSRFRADIETERTERVESTRLQLNAIRQIMRHLRPDGRGATGSFVMSAREPEPGEEDPLVKGVRLRGERHRRWLREGDPSVARRLAQIGVLGWIIVTPMLIGIFAGRWLDQKFNSGLFWTAPLLMLGLGLGCWSAWKWIKDA